MSPRRRLLLALAFALLAGCRGEAETPAAPAARVSAAAESGGSPLVELAAEAVTRLGLSVARVESRATPRTRLFAGQLVVPPGSCAELRVPFAAAVRTVQHGPGERVGAGEPLFVLEAVLPPESERLAEVQRVQLAQARNQLEIARVEAEGALARARSRLAAATQALARVQALVEAEAASARALEEARAEHDAATAELAAAERLGARLGELTQEGALPVADGWTLRAPFAGELTQSSAVPGLVVPAGTSLATFAALDRPWVRVPVTAETAAQVPAGEAARLADADGRFGPAAPRLRPISGLPAAEPERWTVDLWFEPVAPGCAWRPGQRVTVALPVGGTEPRLVVPWSSVILDARGAAWVYVVAGEHRYQRVAAELERVVEGEALLLRGPAAGTAVVAVGAAELYGAEYSGR